MKELETPYGKLYIEDLEYDRHKPSQREEEDRIKIFDSNENYLDYFDVDSIIYDAHAKGIKPAELLANYKKIIIDCKNPEELFDVLGINYELITKNRQEVVNYFLSYSTENFDIENNEWINKIGDYYVVVSET